MTSPYANVPEFAAATPELKAAILAAIGIDDPVHLYPSHHAWLSGWAREEQDVTASQAASLLAYIPPPFYTDPLAVEADLLLTD